MKRIMLILLFVVATLLTASISTAAENQSATGKQWLQKVVALIPYGWEFNKTTCRQIKRKLSLTGVKGGWVTYVGQNEVFYDNGNSAGFELEVVCNEKTKKLVKIHFRGSRYFSAVGLRFTENDVYKIKRNLSGYDYVVNHLNHDIISTYYDDLKITFSKYFIFIDFDNSDY